MPKTTIPAAVLTELTRQFNQELSSAQAYLALSLWCTDRYLPGFAEFFKKQEAEEREHAQKFMQHLLDRDLQPQIAALPAPSQEFDSILAVAQHAHQMERANTRGIHAAYEAALAAKDYAAQVLLHWFINEQVEEEAWTTEMVDRVKAATCAGGFSDLDRHINRYLGAEGE